MLYPFVLVMAKLFYQDQFISLEFLHLD